MSLAEDLSKVLHAAAVTLPEDVARMAKEAAGILGAHVAGSSPDLAEYSAVTLLDHLFRGSAAAGAIQSMPPPPEVAEPEPVEAPAPVAEPEPEPVAEPAADAEVPAPAEAVSAVPNAPPAPPPPAPAAPVWTPPEPPAAV